MLRFLLAILALASETVRCQDITEDASNPLGQCGCQRQMFVDQECSTAFYCSNLNGDPYNPETNMGTLLECPEGQVFEMNLDCADSIFTCVDKGSPDSHCPGTYTLGCEDEPIEASSDGCDCPGQVLVNADCTRAYNCLSGGDPFECSNGQIVQPDIYGGWTLSCVEPEEGSCPNLGGGYKFGCVGDCSDGQTNPYGACSCEQETNQAFLERSGVV